MVVMCRVFVRSFAVCVFVCCLVAVCCLLFVELVFCCVLLVVCCVVVRCL